MSGYVVHSSLHLDVGEVQPLLNQMRGPVRFEIGQQIVERAPRPRECKPSFRAYEQFRGIYGCQHDNSSC